MTQAKDSQERNQKPTLPIPTNNELNLTAVILGVVSTLGIIVLQFTKSFFPNYQKEIDYIITSYPTIASAIAIIIIHRIRKKRYKNYRYSFIEDKKYVFNEAIKELDSQIKTWSKKLDLATDEELKIIAKKQLKDLELKKIEIEAEKVNAIKNAELPAPPTPKELYGKEDG